MENVYHIQTSFIGTELPHDELERLQQMRAESLGVPAGGIEAFDRQQEKERELRRSRSAAHLEQVLSPLPGEQTIVY